MGFLNTNYSLHTNREYCINCQPNNKKKCMDYLSYQEAKEFLINNYKINNYNDWLDLKKMKIFQKIIYLLILKNFIEIRVGKIGEIF